MSTKVFVAHYEHRYGSDTWTFSTREKAELKRQAIAAEWWEEEMEEDPPATAKEMADRYFEKKGEDESRSEHFSIQEVNVDEGEVTAKQVADALARIDMTIEED